MDCPWEAGGALQTRAWVWTWALELLPGGARAPSSCLKLTRFPGLKARIARSGFTCSGQEYLSIAVPLAGKSWQKHVCFQRPIMCVVDSGQMVRVAQPFSKTRIYLNNKQRLPRN